MKKLLLASLLTVWAWCPAFADGTINTLGAAAAVQATDVFPAFQGANPATGVTGAQLKTWTGGGTVTSIGTGCGVSGGTITTTGTISGGVTVSLQTGVNYAFQGTDCGKLINLSNAANQVPTLAQAGTGLFTAGWFVQACNQGVGSQTITPTTSTIGGGASYVLPGGTAASPACITIVSDGTNYQVVPSSTLSPSNSITWTGTQTFNTVNGAINAQSGTTYTLAATDCGKTVIITNASAITLTTLNSIPAGCSIAVEQGGAGQITVANGAGATLTSAHGYTKTLNAAGAIIGLFVDTNSGANAHFVLTGDGV